MDFISAFHINFSNIKPMMIVVCYDSLNAFTIKVVYVLNNKQLQNSMA